jgi:hypothetical protein
VVLFSLGARTARIAFGLAMFLFAAFVLPGVAALPGGQLSQGKITLQGIITISNQPFALLTGGTATFGSSNRRLLGVGQRVDDVEVTAIDVDARTVSVDTSDGTKVAGLGVSATPGSPIEASGVAVSFGAPLGTWVTFDVRNARLDQVLMLVQRLSRRTVLRCEGVSDVELSLASSGRVTAWDFLSAAQRALAAQGISLVPEGDKFLELTVGAPAAEKMGVKAWMAAASKTAARQSAASSKTVPSGMIDFCKADVNLVTQLHSEMTGRSVIRTSVLPASTITLRTETDLTEEEASYAVSRSLALNGISAIPHGDKFMFMVPTSETNRLAEILQNTAAPVTRTNAQLVRTGQIDFRQMPLGPALEMYEQVTGLKIEPHSFSPHSSITLRNQTDLSADEARYALDLALGLSGFKVVPNPDGKTAKLTRFGKRAAPPNMQVR